MHQVLLTILISSLYLGSTIYQVYCLKTESKSNLFLIFLSGSVALIMQTYLLKKDLFYSDGIDLSIFNAISLISISIIGITLLTSLKLKIKNLLIIVYPFGALIVIISPFIKHHHTYLISEQFEVLVHILLSITSYGLLTITAILALLITIQDYQLKHKHPNGLIRFFPPLQTLESLLFSFLWSGWILLTFSIISGWIYIDNIFSNTSLHKTVLSIFAWVIFAYLLCGRYQFGLRGRKAIQWNLIGFTLLLLAYFGTKFVKEVILNYY